MTLSDEYITVYSVGNAEEEKLIKRALADGGIVYVFKPSQTLTEDVSGGFSGEIQVRRSDRKQAVALIKRAMLESLEEPPQWYEGPREYSPAPRPASSKGPIILQIISALLFLVVAVIFIVKDHVDLDSLFSTGKSDKSSGYQDFDEDGNLDGWDYPFSDDWLYRYWDADQDRVPEKMEVFFRDKLFYQSHDADDNGVYEKSISYYPSGKIEYIKYDDNQNNIDERAEQFYPDGGLQLEFFDQDEDGIVELEKLYDMDKRLIEKLKDKDQDGIEDESEILDKEGNMIMKLYDTTGDGMFDKREYYDLKGKLIKTGYDKDYDYEMDKWEYPEGQ